MAEFALDAERIAIRDMARDFANETDSLRRRALKQAAREVLLAESSDWAFILKAINQAVSRLYVHEGTEEDAA